MGGMWDSIKDKASAPTSIVNDDVQEAIDPVRGAPIKTRRTEGLKFAPVDSSAMRDAVAMLGAMTDDVKSEGAPRFVQISASELPRIDLENSNLDLVTEDVPAYRFDVELPAKPARKLSCTDGRGKIARAIKKQEEGDRSKGGRPRKYQTNAERQAAYRLREAIKALPPLPHTRKNK